MILKNNIDKYEGFWGVDAIELLIVYGFDIPTSETECTYPGNYPRCNYIKIVEDQNPTGTFVSSFVVVCKKRVLEQDSPSQDVCNLGKLMVKYKDKKVGED